MKLGNYEVNAKNGFKLLGSGFIGLLILLILSGQLFWKFFMWFGKMFMKFGEYQSKKIDKEFNKKGIEVYK